MKCTVLLVFPWIYTAETCNFSTFYMYTRIYIPYFIHEINCLASVFMCTHCSNMYFWSISYIYKKTHVRYFIQELHCFACVSCVFTAKLCNFGTVFMYTRILMYYTLYMKCTVLIVFQFVFNLILL
jgi:hypothetical protein